MSVTPYLLCFIFFLTHSMEQSPNWEANRFSANQEIPHILWNPNVHYRMHKCPPPVPIVSQLDPVHTPHATSWSCLNIILASTPGSPKWSLSLMFPHQNLVYASPVPYALHVPPISSLITMENLCTSFPHGTDEENRGLLQDAVTRFCHAWHK